MKKYLALALLVSLVGVQAAGGGQGKTGSQPQSWGDLLKMPNPKYVVSAGVSGYAFWRVVRGETDTVFLTKEAMEAAAVAAISYGAVKKAEEFILNKKDENNSILNRKDWKGTAAKLSAGATVGAIAAWRDINPLSGNFNPVDLVTGLLVK